VQNPLSLWCFHRTRKKAQEKDAGANKPISSARSETAAAAFPAQNHNMKYISAPLAIKKRRQQQLPSGALYAICHRGSGESIL